jgi:hypothetical protein
MDFDKLSAMDDEEAAAFSAVISIVQSLYILEVDRVLADRSMSHSAKLLLIIVKRAKLEMQMEELSKGL